MVYRYTDKNGSPLVRCPICNDQLDVTHGITLVISVNGIVQEHDTMLDSDGILIDVDVAVENGYHSATLCGHCGSPLIDMEHVVENDI